jgi:NAD(P)-dependent dehydrogenase (short-subunit alcohol dehydrogenase family)
MHPALTEGRAAVITGGASGIGLAAAKRFASLGMKICLADLSQDALDRAEAEMPGATVITVPTDVSKMDEVFRLKERAYAAFGRVAVLMNNAGTSPGGGPWDHYERWQRVLGVNLQRIDATDQIGAVANGRIEQVEDARTAHHAALRERNDLHRCPIAITLACGKHAFQLRKAAFEVNVDMGAQVAGTARDAFADQITVLRSTAASTAGSSYRFRCGSCASNATIPPEQR